MGRITSFAASAGRATGLTPSNRRVAGKMLVAMAPATDLRDAITGAFLFVPFFACFWRVSSCVSGAFFGG